VRLMAKPSPYKEEKRSNFFSVRLFFVTDLVIMLNALILSSLQR